MILNHPRAGLFGGKDKSIDPWKILRPRPKARLLPAAGVEKLLDPSGADIQGSNSPRSADLMSAQSGAVHTEQIRLKRDLSETLDRIGVKQNFFPLPL